MANLIDRMVRASKLDVNLYEEVEADKGAMGQAIAVVVLSSVAGGIWSIGSLGISGLIWGTLFTLISWVLWAFLIFLVGTKLLPEPQTKSDMGELLRTTGFSTSPGVLRIFFFVPLLNVAILFVTVVWMIIAMVIAVRQALDYKSTWRAIGVCVIAFITANILSWLIFVVLQIPNPFMPSS